MLPSASRALIFKARSPHAQHSARDVKDARQIDFINFESVQAEQDRDWQGGTRIFTLYSSHEGWRSPFKGLQRSPNDSEAKGAGVFNSSMRGSRRRKGSRRRPRPPPAYAPRRRAAQGLPCRTLQ